MIAVAIVFAAALPSATAAQPNSLQPDEISSLIEQAESQVSSVTALIDTLDLRLDTLYDQREVAADDPQRIKTLDTLIDKLNLTISEMDQQRTELSSLLVTLHELAGAASTPKSQTEENQ